MKKTSVYLPEELAARLRRIAEAEGRSQADVLRDAVESYPEPRRERHFFCDGVGRGPGGSIADIPEEELLKGFGES